MSDIAVVWVALGTPTAPTPGAVRPFLREFLMDRRIVDMPAPIWRAILELFILPRRAKVSAGKYASVWGQDESPLLTITRRQTTALHQELQQRGIDAEVAWVMRYGRPSITDVLGKLQAGGVRRVLVVPAYPQYSSTTVGSVYHAVAQHMLAATDELELRFIRSFPTYATYIESLARRIEASWEQNGRPDFAGGDVLLLSYHGVPTAVVKAGDPYPAECQATTDALRARLGLDAEQCPMTFQSKFGPAKWLTPATIDTVGALGRAGVGRVDVACPGFAADCLETLEEIGLLNRARFAEAAPGGVFNRIDCLNDDALFIQALADVTCRGLAGWADATG